MNREDARKFVESWRRAGPALEKVKREELRNLSDDECRRQIQALFGTNFQSQNERPPSGLVEQQRIFQRARQ